jgi:hypothetical protein
MKHIILLLLFTISCGRMSNQKATIKTVESISEIQKFEMFCVALENNSTMPNYIVVTVKNLNTGEIKEICTEAPFIKGAIYRQTGKFSFSADCNDYPNRYFEFSNDSALLNIRFNLYTVYELEQYTKKLDVEKIVMQVRKGILKEKVFCAETKEEWKECNKQQIMFAHIMFNNGIMMTRSCIAGNVCKLYIYD